MIGLHGAGFTLCLGNSSGANSGQSAPHNFRSIEKIGIAPRPWTRVTQMCLLPFLFACCGVSSAKVISVSPGSQTFAYGFWYYLNCTTSLGVGSLSVNIQPTHGSVTVGSTSGPIPGCPAGSPSLPLASSYYTMDITTPPSSSDYFQLEGFLNGKDLGPVDVYVINGDLIGKQLGGCNCSGKTIVGGQSDGGPSNVFSGGLSALGPPAGASSPGRSSAGISVGSGNVFYSVTDYATAGQNPLSYIRYYNSLGSLPTQVQLPVAGVVLSSTLATEAGGNWRSNYDRYLKITSGTTVIAERPDGQQITFTLSGAAWTPDSDIDVTLTQNGSQWTLTDPADTVETYATIPLIAGYSPTSLFAQLTSIRQRNGYTQNLAYTGGVLTGVSDSFGRSLTLAYASGLLQSVTTPDNVISFTYTAGGAGSQLTGVTYSTTPPSSQTYVYENASLPFALTGVIDENGSRFETWGYDSIGRGTSSQLAGGANAQTTAYNGDSSRTVTNALGVTDTYTFTLMQNVPKVTEIDRAATATTAAATETFTYDGSGYLATITDWNGNKTSYQNNSHGLPTTMQEAAGSGVTRTTTIAYDSTWLHLPATVSTADLDIAFTYDGSGEVLTRTLTDKTTGTLPYSTSGQARTWTNSWSNYLLASVQSPNGNTTRFGYDGTGALTSITDPLSHQTQITSHTGGGLPEVIVDPNGVTTTLAMTAASA
jgi:YD repeat-containing protein